jgi:hypothetical protein
MKTRVTLFALTLPAVFALGLMAGPTQPVADGARYSSVPHRARRAAIRANRRPRGQPPCCF